MWMLRTNQQFVPTVPIECAQNVPLGLHHYVSRRRTLGRVSIPGAYFLNIKNDY